MSRAPFPFYILNVYGYTNGHGYRNIAARTNNIIRIGIRELKALPPLPKFLAVDLNAVSADLDIIVELDLHGWTDFGLHADWWGSPAEPPTCQAFNSRGHPSRRDYAIACSMLLPSVSSVNVVWDEHYPLHATASQLRLQTATGHHNHQPRPATKSRSGTRILSRSFHLEFSFFGYCAE